MQMLSLQWWTLSTQINIAKITTEQTENTELPKRRGRGVKGEASATCWVCDHLRRPLFIIDFSGWAWKNYRALKVPRYAFYTPRIWLSERVKRNRNKKCKKKKKKKKKKKGLEVGSRVWAHRRFLYSFLSPSKLEVKKISHPWRSLAGANRRSIRRHPLALTEGTGRQETHSFFGRRDWPQSKVPETLTL